jgi:demethylmenaquinone methyltransferase/2-methoxy-6-polyprenyl-1,4-benzoquinol methylase
VSLLRDYSRQAQSYDDTRAASPSVLVPLREALAGAPGRRLADIGGGTGNYAQALVGEGWEPLVIDRSPEMLARATAKGLTVVEADAQQLPFRTASFDAAMILSVLHHVEDPPAALAEARRILRAGGRLAVGLITKEDLRALWYLDYFPVAQEWMERSHPGLDEMLEHLPGARRLPIRFADLEDASLAALAAYPQLILEQRWRRQTSFFERMERDHPGELHRGLERLAADLGDGRGPRPYGIATMLSWTKAPN